MARLSGRLSVPGNEDRQDCQLCYRLALYTGSQVSPWFQKLPWASLVAQRLKYLPGMRETWVRSRGREDPLEKEMATHSSILAWRIPWTEEPGGLQSMGPQESDTTEQPVLPLPTSAETCLLIILDN